MSDYGIACVLSLLPLPIGAAIALLASRRSPWGETAPASVTLVRVLVPFWALFTLTLCVPGQLSFALDAGRGLALFSLADAGVALFLLVAVVRLARRAAGSVALSRRAAWVSIGFHGLVAPLGVALFFFAVASTSGRALSVEDLPETIAALVVVWLGPGLAVAALVLAAARAAEPS